MKRTIAVVILAVAALALLVSLTLQSRSIPIDAHIAQHTVTTEAARIGNEFGTLSTALQSAWQKTKAPGAGEHAIAAGLASSTDNLRKPVSQVPGTATQRARIRNAYQTLVHTTSQANALTGTLLNEMTTYAASVSYLRENGPQILQRMRDIQLNRAAAAAFRLIVGTLDYASPDTQVRGSELRRLLTALQANEQIDANMPQDAKQVFQAVSAVLDNKSDIQSKLIQLTQLPVSSSAANLADVTSTAYTDAVAKTDRARLMLAVYAVVLLLSVGAVAFRLQGSYREINRANAELASLNESLEQRVSERTEELEGTLVDLKESQVQLVQAEKMSSLGQLVAGISHEINTPLLYLANNATLIEERLQLFGEFVTACIAAFDIRPEDFDKRSTYQRRFVQSLRKLKNMIKEDELQATIEEAQDLARDSIEGLADLTEMAQSLKDFSRLDRAPVASFDVNSGLEKTLLIAKNIIKHKAEVRKFYGDVPEVQCSPSQINQVFLNLITNAAQAIEEHGEIIVATKQYDEERVAITVTDTGCGISPENLTKIRDPFFTTKPVGSGTGLGLSIVDEIVRSHGGELLVNSEVGRGSTFTLLLPIKHEPSETTKQTGQGDEPDDAFDGDARTLAEAV